MFLDDIVGLYLFALAYVLPSGDALEGCKEFVFALSLSEDDLSEDELPKDSQSILQHLDSVREIG